MASSEGPGEVESLQSKYAIAANRSEEAITGSTLLSRGWRFIAMFVALCTSSLLSAIDAAISENLYVWALYGQTAIIRKPARIDYAGNTLLTLSVISILHRYYLRRHRAPLAGHKEAGTGADYAPLLIRYSDPAVRAALDKGGTSEHSTAGFVHSLAGDPQLQTSVTDVYVSAIKLVWQVGIGFAGLGVIVAPLIKEALVLR
ncbi:hypothetical protein F5Y09DRAFT_337787 [Xylaria sp. FL1042]|nr:hypothetical protein F5Y09DRAFT_337787 [Xylaria sp. FL1042]